MNVSADLCVACEKLAELARSPWSFAKADMRAATELCELEPMLKLIESYSDDYIHGVCASVRRGGELDASRRRKGYVLTRSGKGPHIAITDKQRRLLAVALLERFITARAAVAVAWGIGEDEVQRLMEESV